MKYLSVCSGIASDAVAWGPLGWECAAVAEIDPFCSALLSHYYPTVPNLGDMSKIGDHEALRAPVDVLAGGTPCQSFSVAGLRKGLDDDRGNLALEYCRLASRLRPSWIVWENVPGVLSQNEGRDFGAILGGLADIGYGFAYRVLDAQYYGLAQRRKRVFLVGYLGDWRPPAAVLFEPESVRWHPPPSREAWQEVAPTLDARSKNGIGTDFDMSGGQVAVATEFDVAGTMMSYNKSGGLDNRIDRAASGYVAMISATHVRRFTPIECERLQGFPDDYTLISYRKKPASDGPRYKAIGNAIATPVLRWIGERIMIADEVFPR